MPAAMPQPPEVQVFQEPGALFRAVADRFVEACRTDVATRGAFHVALTGGPTPRELYLHLADPVRVDATPWEEIHLYFGEERCVPPGHPDSNYTMARAALIDPVPIPVAHVHRMEGERDPRRAAEDYGRMLEARLSKREGPPILDLVLLGLCREGSGALPFPGTETLGGDDSVTVVQADEQAEPRLSLTLPVINAARRVWLIASGAEKADILRTVFDGSRNPSGPRQGLDPTGEWAWFLDRAASRYLDVPATSS